jgi:hypothetical protein
MPPEVITRAHRPEADRATEAPGLVVRAIEKRQIEERIDLV